MTLFGQYLVNGLSLGAIYGLMAVGLTLIFGAARIGNFAHGDFFMIGAYTLVISLDSFHLPFWLAAVLTVLSVVLLATVTYGFVFRQLLNRGNALSLFVGAIGISIVLEAGANTIFGPTPRSISLPTSLVRVAVGPFTISLQRLLAVGGALCAFAMLYWFLRSSRLGKSIRAVSQNREAAQVVGINVDVVRTATFVLSGGLAALASLLVGPIYPVYPLVGLILVLKAFAIVIMGGLGSVQGAIVGAFILGIAESLTAGYISLEMVDMLAFVTMILVLLVRPAGLFKADLTA